jgi:hypothetical protein
MRRQPGAIAPNSVEAKPCLFSQQASGFQPKLIRSASLLTLDTIGILQSLLLGIKKLK